MNEIKIGFTATELVTLYALIEAELEKVQPEEMRQELQRLQAKFAASILQSCRDCRA